MKFNFKKNRMGNKSFSQINVTPFVDVMLVLLIVFMITAPLLTVGVKVDLPKTKASQLKAISENNKNIRIFVKGDKNANYGSVLNVLARIKSAGYSKATLVAKLKN